MKYYSRITKVAILTAGLCMAGGGVVHAQTASKAQHSGVEARTITGTVYEKGTGETLPGVNVSVWQGGELVTGVSTDVNGKYSLRLPDGNYELHLSYVGFRNMVVPSAKVKAKGMKIYLIEDDNKLEDFVVTGYFNKNKNTFTGSVTQISGEDLKLVTGVNVINAIAALTPGLEMVVNNEQGSNPNHVPELVMRGMSSFSNDGQDVNQPTIILDGTEISMAELYDLDMNEIESINVLKDAAATALYGSKAANGVIVITRKPLSEGKPRVAYSFTGNVQIPKLSDYHVLNAAQKLEYERLAGLYDANGAIDANTGLPQQYELDMLYNERYKAVASGQESDWLSQAARTSFSHDHSVRIYGGANNLRYELNGRFADTKGVMKGDDRRRYSIGYKLDYFINNKILISNRSTYSEVSTLDSPYGDFSQYTSMNPYDRMYNDDGTANTDLSWDAVNPLYEATLGSYKKTATKSFSNSTDARWEISNLFRLTGHFNITSSTGDGNQFVSPNSLTYRYEDDLTKRGAYYKTSNKGTTLNGNVVGSFNKMFEDESLISTSVGWEINYSNSSADQFSATGFFSDKMSNINNAVGYPSTGKPSGSTSRSADVGGFISANYSFRNRYFIDGTWRLTGSSLFGENNRWGNFWSAGAGWNIMNESFMKDIKKHFDVFKLRGSVGYTGKAKFSAYQAMTMYQYSNNLEYKNGIGATPLTIGDVNLCWERTRTTDVGIDLSMFGRRLNFTMDYYIKSTSNLLLDRSLAPSTGVTTATQNLGELQNRGLEFSLNGYVIQNKNFLWKLGVTGYTNTNKITKISEALKELNQKNEEMSTTQLKPLPQYAEGESVTALKLVRSAGIDPATGKEIYIKRDGTLTFTYDSSDKVYIGDTDPRFYGTANTTLQWKGIMVYALFSYRLGAWMYNTTRASKVEGANPKYNADERVFTDRWKNPGDVAIYKDIADTSTPKQTDRFAEKENTLSLSTLNISYEFGQQLIKPLGLKQLRAGLNFTDLFRISTVKIERGTSYLYSKGFEVTLNATF